MEEEIAGIAPWLTLHFCSRSYSNFLPQPVLLRANPEKCKERLIKIIDSNTEAFFLHHVNSQRIVMVNKAVKAPFR